MTLMIGTRINGRYHILETIGGGGMAYVYKARDVILDRIVAVKVLQPQFSRDEQFIKRFRREAQAATSLAHPNVVSIFDVGEEEDVYYIVMEYVEGPTLKELIQDRGALSLDETVDIMMQVTSAIAHAHANQIVHRDIKPHNILISSDGEAKVTDFGIARAMSSATITHTNSVMGSVHYLSPEQARGGVVTYRSDIYSLGIVLYEMVTGQVPFSGDTAVTIALKHLQEDVPSPKKVNRLIPQSLENIILRSTAKDAFHRYESALEMGEDLETSLDPARTNEPKFVIPSEEDDVTKAIPIIKNDNTIKDLDATIEARPPVNKAQKEEVKPEEKPKKKKKNRWLTFIFVLFFLIIGSGVAAFALFPSLLKVDEVEVINVVGEEVEEAEALLKDLGLAVEIERMVHEEVPEDHVIRQDPAGGSVVKVGSRVKLFVSEGQEKFEMPEVVGMQRERAERILGDFKNIELAERESDETPGVILTQVPEPGTPVIVEETTVYLTYSVEQTVSLNNLRGLTEREAYNYLDGVGLLAKVTYAHSNDVQKDQVISQSPSAFTQVKKGSEVALTISKGPEPKKPEEKKEERKPETEQSRPLTSTIPIQVDEGDDPHILIRYEDATTDGEQVHFDDRLLESRTFRIDLVVSPRKDAIVKLYINGEHYKDYTYTY